MYVRCMVCVVWCVLYEVCGTCELCAAWGVCCVRCAVWCVLCEVCAV